MADKSTLRILEGPLAFEIARFGTPLAIGMVLQTLFNLVDAYLVAQLPAGERAAAIGALGICDQLAALGTIFSYGVSTATGALLSQQKGARDDAGIRRTAYQSLLVVGALSVAFGMIGVFGSGWVVREVIGAKGEVAVVAERYLRVMIGGSFSVFFLLQLTGIMRALGSAKTPVFFLVLGNVFNVIFALVLIFGDGPPPFDQTWIPRLAVYLGIPKLGMLGAAWATIFARTIVLLPLVWILVRRFPMVRPSPSEYAPDPKEIGRILAIAWPSSTQFVIRIAGMLLVNSLVARYFTTATDQTATTAMGLVFRLDTMALFVAMGWGSAAQTFVGQNLGARNVTRAMRSGWITAAYDAVSNLVLLYVIYRTGEWVLRIFCDDSAPVAIALGYLRAVAPTYLALGVGVVLGNAIAGAGATRTTMWLDLLAVVGFQLPVSLLVVGALGAGKESLFYVVGATNVVAMLLYVVVYGRGRWRRSALHGPPA